MTKNEYIEKCRKELEDRLRKKGCDDDEINERIFVPDTITGWDKETIKRYFDDLEEFGMTINKIR